MRPQHLLDRVSGGRSSNGRTSNSSSISCWICQGPHRKSDCPNRKPRRSKPSRATGAPTQRPSFNEGSFPALSSTTVVCHQVAESKSSWASMASKPAVKVAPEKPVFKTQRPTPVNTATKIHPAVRIASVAPEKDNSAWSDDEDETPLHKDPKMFYADGTMKSWADLCDEESSDDEEW